MTKRTRCRGQGILFALVLAVAAGPSLHAQPTLTDLGTPVMPARERGILDR